MFAKRFFLLLCFFCSLQCAFSQSLTGTWEGDILDDGEFLQINIVQTGDRLCGFTWDYVYDNEKSYCKANFTGTFNKEKNTWFLNGTDMFVNSGTHVLMQLLFLVDYTGKKPMISGYCRLKPTFISGGSEPSRIRLYKVSKKPFMVTEGMKSCIAENKLRNKPVPKPRPPAPPKPAPPKPAPPVKPKPVPPATTKPRTPPKPNTPRVTPVKPPQDTIPPVAVKPMPITEMLPQSTAGRSNKEISRITVHEKKITLNIYDNAETDGDSVSVYYNGRLLRSHLRLTDKPIVLDVDLDAGTTLHTIVMYAENLGEIPPNTALIIFTDPKGKRYELFCRSDLGQNAMLVFEYKP